MLGCPLLKHPHLCRFTNDGLPNKIINWSEVYLPYSEYIQRPLPLSFTYMQREVNWSKDWIRRKYYFPFKLKIRFNPYEQAHHLCTSLFSLRWHFKDPFKNLAGAAHTYAICASTLKPSLKDPLHRLGWQETPSHKSTRRRYVYEYIQFRRLDASRAHGSSWLIAALIAWLACSLFAKWWAANYLASERARLRFKRALVYCTASVESYLA